MSTVDIASFQGRVGVNTDRPDEHLSVHGNVKVTGHMIQPSDRRLKTDFKEVSFVALLKQYGCC